MSDPEDEAALASLAASMNLEAPESKSTIDNMGKEWTKLVEPESGKEYYYNVNTKDTMWYKPQPGKDYELRPPFGWYAVEIAEHIYLHNPQKNLIKMPEDVTFADANPREEEPAESNEKKDNEPVPSILRIEKVGSSDNGDNGNEDHHGGGSDGSKKIIF